YQMAWAMSAPLGRLLPLEGDDHLPDRLHVRRLLDPPQDDLFENVPGEDVADRLAVLPLQAGVLLVQPFGRPADVAEDLFQRTPFVLKRRLRRAADVGKAPAHRPLPQDA